VSPQVTVVVPALDEALHIEACVRSILAQEVDGDLELLVVDGASSDDTAELARAAGATVLENPRRTIPAALNLGLEAAAGEVLVRFDAHSEMPPRYIATCLRALDEEPDAVNAGGWLDVRAEGPWGDALAAVLATPAGIGNARLWRRPAPGEDRADVESVPFGAYRIDAVRAAGGWDELLLTNEDFDLNHRLRRAGGRIVFDPEIWSIYRPRESIALLARQYWRYGRWKAAMVAAAPESLRPRHVAPLGLLGAVAAAPASRTARAGLLAYAAVAGGVAVRSGRWRAAPLLATIHLSWGAGVVTGLARSRRRG
jgi:succinoglycan biosynthesis protein ExoA